MTAVLYLPGFLFFLAALFSPVVRVVWCVALVLGVACGVAFWRYAVGQSRGVLR